MTTENKHTPAPWYVQETTQREDIIASEKTGHTIARCNSYADNMTQANARLIAAAPDMYEALENLVANYLSKDVDAKVLKHFIDEAIKALDKAKEE